MSKKIFLIIFLILFGVWFFLISQQPKKVLEFNPEILLKKYSEDEIAHFAYFAFQEGGVRKWMNDIRYKIEHRDSLNIGVLGSITSCVEWVNSNVDLISILEVKRDYNVSISLVDSVIPGYSGLTYKYYNKLDPSIPEIVSGKIIVVLKGNELPYINSTLFHEFSHLLGFNHNQDLYRESGWTYKSLFNQSTTTYVDSLWDFVPDFTEFSDLDKAAIRIMYDKDVGIEPGLTKKKFFRLIEKAKKEMDYGNSDASGE